MAVRLTNLTDKDIGVDLRGDRPGIYPNQWGVHDQSHRGVINEGRLAHKEPDADKVRADFKAVRLTTIPTGKSTIVYTEFNASGRADVDASKGKYFIASMDGQIPATDGKTVATISCTWKEKRGAAETDVVLPFPVAWREKKDDPIPAVKDADADKWLKANYAKFRLQLAIYYGEGAPHINLVTGDFWLDKVPADGAFKLTAPEAAAIVQALVDSGLWSRSDPPPPGLLGPGRYMFLSNGKMWKLGDTTDDVSSRFIIQHLLKLGGEREKSLRAWLAYREKPKHAPEASVRLVGEWHDGEPKFGPMLVIKNAGALAKAIPDKATLAAINKKVDFAKERLVGFSFMGGSDSKMTFAIDKGEEPGVVTFQPIHGKAKNKALNSFLFAIPNGIAFAGGPPPAKAAVVRELHHWLGGPDLGPQAVFTDAGAVAKAFGHLPLEDRVNITGSFAKERFVGFTWMGGADSKMTHDVQTGAAGTVVVFNRHLGTADEVQRHTWLFAVANDASFRVEGDPEPPVANPVARRLNVTVVLADPNRFIGPPKITSNAELVKMFPDKKTRESITKQIDFTKEYLVWFAWSGSAGDKYTFKINSGVKDGKEQPIVAFRFHASADKGEKHHLQLFAISKTAILAGDPPAPKVVEPVREIELGGRNPTPNDKLLDAKKPTKIETYKALAARFEAKELADKVATQVDFDKEYLLYFRWGGSGGDTLFHKVANGKDGPIIIFRYIGGPDPDYRQHWRLFVLPRNATWKVIVGEVPAGARNKEPLREINIKDFKPTIWAVEPKKPTRFTSAKELADVFDQGTHDLIAGQVDFEEEHLLYFVWARGRESLVPVLRETPQGTEVVLQWTRYPGFVFSKHVKLFVIPAHATWRLEEVPPPADVIHEIELAPAKFPRHLGGDPKRPTKIADKNDLVKAIEDLDERDLIARQVDFDKEYLLYFGWNGSSGDHLLQKIVHSKDGPIAFFRHVGGAEEKAASHHKLFVLPKKMAYRVAQQSNLLRPEGQRAVREISLVGFTPKDFTADPSKAIRITSAAEAGKIFTAKNWLENLTHNLVDFDEEHLMYFAWSGGGGEQLTGDLKDVKGVPTVTFHHYGPGNDAKATYVRLFVVPFNADWKLMSKRLGEEK